MLIILLKEIYFVFFLNFVYMIYFLVLNENILEFLRKLFVRILVFIKVSLYFKKLYYNEIELKLNRNKVFIEKMLFKFVIKFFIFR